MNKATKNVKNAPKTSKGAVKASKAILPNANKKSDGDGYTAQAEGVTHKRVCDMRLGEYRTPAGAEIMLGSKDALRGVVLKRTHEMHRMFVFAYIAGRALRMSEFANAGIDASSPHLNSMKDREFISPGTFDNDGSVTYSNNGREYVLTLRAIERIRANGGLCAGDGLLCDKPGKSKPKTNAKRKSK